MTGEGRARLMTNMDDSFEHSLKNMFADVETPESLSPDNIASVLRRLPVPKVVFTAKRIMSTAAVLVLVIGISAVSIRYLRPYGEKSSGAADRYAYETAEFSEADCRVQLAGEGVEEPSAAPETAPSFDVNEMQKEDAAQPESPRPSTKKGCLPECTEDCCVPECPNYKKPPQ
ncbi:MAG: hypothetical protein RR933_04430 [Oscillospiraceae bacterium]